MPAFAVFEPSERKRGSGVHSDGFVFLREGFSLGAFLFGPFWMIWRRQWLVLLIYLIVLGGVEYGLRRLGIPVSARLMVYVLISLLIGLEAASLRRWTMLRGGWRDCGIIIADDLEMAERRFFDARSVVAPAAKPSAPVSPSYSSPNATGSAVLGLFPEPGGSR